MLHWLSIDYKTVLLHSMAYHNSRYSHKLDLPLTNNSESCVLNSGSICKLLLYIFMKLNSVYTQSILKNTVFFFFSFAYTTSPAAVMKLVVFFRSSKPPYNFWWSGVADSHCAILSGWCPLHLWRTCSVVWSSSPQGHVGGRNDF